MKKLFRTDKLWAKVRKKKHITDVLYGERNKTNVHGHTVISGMDVIIYQRIVSGMVLSQSGGNLYLNNDVL